MTEAPKLFCDMLNWKLKSGSHEFPGPDGGTCINEAAIVVAGFEYKSVKSWQDCPPCFSPIISQFAIFVNDKLNDVDRQALIPFVTRMAGTRGTAELEERRCIWLAQQAINVDLARVLRREGLCDLSAMCEAAKTLPELRKAVHAVRTSVSASASASASASVSASACAFACAFASASASAFACASASVSVSASASACASASASACACASVSASAFDFKPRTIELLEGLINFEGAPKQEIEMPVALARLTKAREKVAA